MQYNPAMTSKPSFLWCWAPAILMMVVIFGFSSIPSDEMLYFGVWDYLVKKGGHAFGYGLLALSYLCGLKGESPEAQPRWFYTAWVMAVLYSTTDEFHQSFVPGRHPAVTDVLIDACGAALALALAAWFYKRKRPVVATDR